MEGRSVSDPVITPFVYIFILNIPEHWMQDSLETSLQPRGTLQHQSGSEIKDEFRSNVCMLFSWLLERNCFLVFILTLPNVLRWQVSSASYCLWEPLSRVAINWLIRDSTLHTYTHTWCAMCSGKKTLSQITQTKFQCIFLW